MRGSKDRIRSDPAAQSLKKRSKPYEPDPAPPNRATPEKMGALRLGRRSPACLNPSPGPSAPLFHKLSKRFFGVAEQRGIVGRLEFFPEKLYIIKTVIARST